MNALSLPAVHRLSGTAPVVARVVAGVVLLVHGADKLIAGPAGFGAYLGQGLGLPAPTLLAWLVTLLELVGGLLLVAGLLSRITAAVLTLHLVAAIVTTNVKVGFLTPMEGGGTGVEFPLTVIACLLVVLLLGPGGASVDRAIGLERRASQPVRATSPAVETV